MDKDQVASVLEEIGTLLELQGENPFRCNAYHNAARAIQQMEGNLSEIVGAGKLKGIAGIGETLQEKITALVTQGHLPFYDELKSKIPAGLAPKPSKKFSTASHSSAKRESAFDWIKPKRWRPHCSTAFDNVVELFEWNFAVAFADAKKSSATSTY